MIKQYFDTEHSAHDEHGELSREVRATRNMGVAGWLTVVIALAGLSWQYTQAQTAVHERLSDDVAETEKVNAEQTEAIRNLQSQTIQLGDLIRELDQSIDENTEANAALSPVMEDLRREIERLREREN